MGKTYVKTREDLGKNKKMRIILVMQDSRFGRTSLQ